MSDAAYIVGIDFDVADLESKLRGLHGPAELFERAKTSADGLSSRMRGLADAASEIGGRMSDAFAGAVEKVGELGLKFGTMGATAGVAAASFGIHLNSEIEKTKIGLADILTVNGVTGDLNAGMKMSADLMEQIRKDAAALPGETADLAKIFKMASIPGLQAGASPAQLEKLSANAMAFGMGVADLDSGTVARELSMLLSGRAGAHNVLGAQLGLVGEKATAFNAGSQQQHLAETTKLLAAHSGSIDLFGNSFEGKFSSMIDNAKRFLSLTTAPLFEAMKTDLDWINEKLGGSGELAERLGNKLADAFNRGFEFVQKWAPVVEHMGERLYETLANPHTWERVEHVLQMYGALKIANAASSFISPLTSALGGIGGISGAAGPMGAILAATVGTAVVGETSALANPASEHHADAARAASEMSENLQKLSADLGPGSSFWSAIEALGAAFTEDAAAFVGGLDDIMNFRKTLNTVFDRDSVNNFFDTLKSLGSADPTADMEQSKKDREAMDTFKASWEKDTVEIDRNYELSPASAASWAGSMVAEQKKLEPKKVTGGGGMAIAKVEISVSSNQEPSRIARHVFQKFAEASRYPTSSPNVPNFLSGRL